MKMKSMIVFLVAAATLFASCSSEVQSVYRIRASGGIDYVAKEQGNAYAAVGHSQGGERALAYAKMLKERNPEEYKKLKAVITVSGVDKGLKALDGCSVANGFTPFKAKLMNDAGILTRGAIGFFGSSLLLSAITVTGGTYWISTNTNTIYDAIEKAAPYLDSYITCGLQNGPYSQLAEIYDMMPKSNFIEKNVSETKTINYKLKTGTTTNLVWKYYKVWGVKIYYLTVETNPVYTTYTAYQDVPKFDSNLPVGYIVGTNSDTLSMLDSSTEKSVRDGCGCVATCLRVAQGINIAKCVASLGLLSYHATYAIYCDKAAGWLDDIDGELNELKGSSENDGLVAKESQFYPKQFYNPATGVTVPVHEKVLGEQKENGYYTCFNYNHADICPESDANNHSVKRRVIEMLNSLQ